MNYTTPVLPLKATKRLFDAPIRNHILQQLLPVKLAAAREILAKKVTPLERGSIFLPKHSQDKGAQCRNVVTQIDTLSPTATTAAERLDAWEAALKVAVVVRSTFSNAIHYNATTATAKALVKAGVCSTGQLEAMVDKLNQTAVAERTIVASAQL